MIGSRECPVSSIVHPVTPVDGSFVVDQFGFTHHKFTCNSDLHSICAPGFCSESLSRKLHHTSSSLSSSSRRQRFSLERRSILSSSSKGKKLREHFEYNHIPAMISSLQNYSVHGIVNGCSTSSGAHGDTVMLLIHSIVLEKSKFIIVDLKLNRYICALGDDYHGLIDPRKVHAAWSNDRTQVIARVPTLDGTASLDFYKSRRRSHGNESLLEFSTSSQIENILFYLRHCSRRRDAS